jgi:hypothetical protein
MVHEKAFDDDALHDQIERVDHDRPSAHVGIDDEDPVRAEHAGDHCAALARNAVDSELHAAVADRCPDLVERAVFVHNHEIAADGLQLRDEFRATHEIDCLNAARFGNGDERPADTWRLSSSTKRPTSNLATGSFRPPTRRAQARQSCRQEILDLVGCYGVVGDALGETGQYFLG